MTEYSDEHDDRHTVIEDIRDTITYWEFWFDAGNWYGRKTAVTYGVNTFKYD